MKTAVITGCEGGIGEALVAAFEGAGYRVIGVDRHRTSRRLPDDLYVSIDLNDFVEEHMSRDSAIGALKERLGVSGLNALVNNAALQRAGHFLDLTERDWRESLNVNLVAPVLLVKSLYAALAKARGAVVNISSIHATQTKPEFSAYSTSKAALNGLTRALAGELGQAVRFNAVAPAAIDTSMLRAGFGGDAETLSALHQFHPVGRIGRPAEVANLCVYLCSESAAFINGAVISIDGGISGRLHDPA